MLLYVMFSLCLSFFRSLLAWLVTVIGLLVFAETSCLSESATTKCSEPSNLPLSHDKCEPLCCGW